MQAAGASLNGKTRFRRPSRALSLFLVFIFSLNLFAADAPLPPPSDPASQESAPLNIPDQRDEADTDPDIDLSAADECAILMEDAGEPSLSADQFNFATHEEMAGAEFLAGTLVAEILAASPGGAFLTPLTAYEKVTSKQLEVKSHWKKVALNRTMLIAGYILAFGGIFWTSFKLGNLFKSEPGQAAAAAAAISMILMKLLEKPHALLIEPPTYRLEAWGRKKVWNFWSARDVLGRSRALYSESEGVTNGQRINWTANFVNRIRDAAKELNADDVRASARTMASVALDHLSSFSIHTDNLFILRALFTHFSLSVKRRIPLKFYEIFREELRRLPKSFADLKESVVASRISGLILDWTPCLTNSARDFRAAERLMDTGKPEEAVKRLAKAAREQYVLAYDYPELNGLRSTYNMWANLFFNPDLNVTPLPDTFGDMFIQALKATKGARPYLPEADDFIDRVDKTWADRPNRPRPGPSNLSRGVER